MEWARMDQTITQTSVNAQTAIQANQIGYSGRLTTQARGRLIDADPAISPSETHLPVAGSLLLDRGSLPSSAL
jgi:hypothetical protein